jgi:hypothetical protein
MQFQELLALFDTAAARHTSDGLTWPLSLTFADGTHLPAVRCRSLHGSGGPAAPVRQRLIGHDLGRNVLIDVSMDDVTDARLTEEAWEEVVLPEPASPGEDLLSWASYERKRAKAVLTENVAMTPLKEDVLPFSFVALDFSSPYGGEPSRFEATVATSLIDKQAVAGSKVWVEYEEPGPGRIKVVRIDPRDS